MIDTQELRPQTEIEVETGDENSEDGNLVTNKLEEKFIQEMSQAEPKLLEQSKEAERGEPVNPKIVEAIQQMKVKDLLSAELTDEQVSEKAFNSAGLDINEDQEIKSYVVDMMQRIRGLLAIQKPQIELKIKDYNENISASDAEEILMTKLFGSEGPTLREITNFNKNIIYLLENKGFGKELDIDDITILRRFAELVKKYDLPPKPQTLTDYLKPAA